MYISYYDSPIGRLLLGSIDNKLVGLWIENQNNYLSSFKEELIENDNLEIFIKTKNWLDRYFNKEKCDIRELEIDLIGSEFRKTIWKILCTIPYGSTKTYKDICNEYTKLTGKRMFTQAVGSAIGHNPISIIVPCHRVVGMHNKMGGYAGGIDNKLKLLELESIDISKYKLN